MAILHWISALTARIVRTFSGRYRPEQHYMRGAGPASKRSHGHGAG
jgi:hypothetical protein